MVDSLYLYVQFCQSLQLTLCMLSHYNCSLANLIIFVISEDNDKGVVQSVKVLPLWGELKLKWQGIARSDQVEAVYKDKVVVHNSDVALAIIANNIARTQICVSCKWLVGTSVVANGGLVDALNGDIRERCVSVAATYTKIKFACSEGQRQEAKYKSFHKRVIIGF